MIDYEVVKCSQICSYMFFCNVAKQIQIKVINIVSHIHKMREWLNKRFCYYCFLQEALRSTTSSFILLLFRRTKTTLDCFANEANLNKCCFPSQKLLLQQK